MLNYSPTITEEQVNRANAELVTVGDDDLATVADDEPGGNGKGQLDVGRDRIEFHRITCRELDSTTYQLNYLIEDTLVANQPCIVAGGKKSLKTSFVIDMGIALAMGGFFLGKLKVARACRVGIMSGESGMAVIQETARRICEAANYRLGDIGNLVFSESIPQFDNPVHLPAIRAFVENDELEVLVIDPTYLAMRGADAGNLFIQGEMLRTVNQVCADTGVTLVLVHHCRKGGKADPFEPPELEDIAWAGFQEWCRQWLLIGRREKYEPGTGEHRLWLNVGGSAGHSALWAVDVAEGTRPDRYWEVGMSHASAAREDSARRRGEAKSADRQAEAEAKLEDDKKHIVQAATRFPDGETESQLRAHSGVHQRAWPKALASLLDDNHLVPCDVTKPNRKTPYPGYKPNPTPL